jgi:hypothetical protein
MRRCMSARIAVASGGAKGREVPDNNRMNPTKPAMASGTRASRVIRVFDGLLG